MVLSIKNVVHFVVHTYSIKQLDYELEISIA